MKNLFSVILLLISVIGKSQMRADFGSGFSNQSTLAAELAISVSSKDYFAQIGYISHLSRMVDKGTFFNFRSGMVFYLNDKVKLLPSVGVYYHLKNSDYNFLNTTGVMISQKAYIKKDQKTDFFVNLIIAERAAFLTAGLSGLLVPEKKITRISKTSPF
jgi:hypothetical protein